MASTSANGISVTGSLWECLWVVGQESQGGQIPEFTGPMQWPSGAPGSACERRQQARVRRRQAGEHLGAPATSLGALTKCLGAPTTSLGAHRITVEQSWKDIIFSGDAAGVPGDYSHYLSLTISKTHVFSLYSHLYIYASIYIRHLWTGCRRW